VVCASRHHLGDDRTRDAPAVEWGHAVVCGTLGLEIGII
jgi:hypothetical protein